MQRARQRTQVAPPLCGSNSHGKRWRFDLCVLLGTSLLILGSVVLLQLRLTTVDQNPSHLSAETQQLAVNLIHGGKGEPFQGGDGSGEERGQKMARLWKKMENKETGSFDSTEGATASEDSKDSSLSKALKTEEEVVGSRVEQAEYEDIEDKDLDEFQSFGEDVGERVHNGDPGVKRKGRATYRDNRLQEDGGDEDFGAKPQQNRELMVGGSGGGIRAVEEASLTSAKSNLYIKGRSKSKKLEAGNELRGLPRQEPVKLWDQSKGNARTGVFSTDDEPIDEETRHRLENMLDIEDALMLNSGASSSKKESWGSIQDGQSSKKEKVAMLLSDPLNPENNPLLQDPDSAGPGGLTKNDRALLKAFRWTHVDPHLQIVNRTVHVHAALQKEPDARVQDDLEEGKKDQCLNRGDASAIEHKELDTEVPPWDTVRSGDLGKLELEQSKGISNPNAQGNSGLGDRKVDNTEASSESISEVSTRKEVERPKGTKKGAETVHKLNPEDDWIRWGDFPGLHPRLTFSGFIEEFLFNEWCSMRVFMAWMTPPWSFTVRHQRVLESLLHFHPNACVVVFSETIELHFFKSFAEDGYHVAAVMPNLKELLEDTPSDVFTPIWFEWRKVDLFYIHYTELLRLAALYKYGGIYLDWDMIVLKPLTGLANNTIGSELLENGQLRPNGAIMLFEQFSPFLNRSMEEFTATYDETMRDWNGAALLERVMNAPLDVTDVKLAIGDKPHVEPPISFFPLSSANIYRYFKTPEDEDAIAEELGFLDEILLRSFTVHVWNKLTYNLIPEPGSLVEKLMERNCLRCTDIL